jgi:Tfp pilus assembly protein FimT
MAMFVAVMLSAAVVVNLNVISGKRIEMTGRSITADLIWARQMAVNTNQDYIVNFLINNTTDALDGYEIYFNTVSAATRLKSRYVNAVQLVAIKNRSSIDALTNLTPARIRFKPTGTITDSNNAPINIGGLQMTLGTKNVYVGIFGETGQVVYKDWITPGCFIATAAYQGSQRGNTPAEVIILEKFRDRYLTPTRWGRACTAFYYEASPLLAQYIETRLWLRFVTRAILQPVVWCAKGLVDS